MTIKELRTFVAQALLARRNGNDDLVIYPVDMLDPVDLDPALNNARYGVFIEQSYITRPIPAHWLPVPEVFNSFIESRGI